MTEIKGQPVDNAELRRRAEELIGKKTGTAHPSGTEEEPLRLHHELQVHQVELEMQNAELRHSRDELEIVLEEYTDLYDFAPVSYFTLDHKGTISKVNLTGASRIGVERSLLIGMNFELFVTVEVRPVFTTFLGKVFTSQAKESCELTLLKKGNSPLYVQVEGWAAKTGQTCHIALIDITERKRVEEVLRLANQAADALRRAQEAETALRLVNEAAETLRQAKEKAEAVALAKSQFLANMSHELRTPMTGILGMLHLALMKELATEPRDYIETAMNSAQSLLRILNDILDMAKFEAGALTIEENPFALKRCITEVANIIAPEVRRKGLDFTISVAEEVPDAVFGDQMRLRQVLINLAANAVKFTDRGNVELRVTAEKAGFDGKREFTFTVTDTGIGIPENKKELLFRAFSQVDPSLSRKYGGTGLGLTICREIVELMGGTISFESGEGVGSNFTFTIPLGEAILESDNLSVDESLSPEAISITQEGERIAHLLLVEDDPVIRQVLGGMLEINYTLDFAEDGQKAVEMWEKGVYDLVLMDIQMPRLNGFEATRAIREKERERGGRTPIVAMTAHASKEDGDICLAQDMDAFIPKPINFKMSLQVIGDIIKKKTSGV